jgi:hypothetical protein
MSLRTVSATRYVTPLREGGSLPAIVEADDDGMYVLKFRGAGQGVKALIAEVIAGGIARALQLPLPEMVLIALDVELARTEPDPEIQDLIRASAGINFALDYLPGAITFDPVADRPSAQLASRIVWFDAFISNVDRTPRNANLLMWHGGHGSSAAADRPFDRIRDHVLLPWADAIEAADAESSRRLDRAVLDAIVAQVPDDWLQGPDAFGDPATQREAYVDYLAKRLRSPRRFVEEVGRARA